MSCFELDKITDSAPNNASITKTYTYDSLYRLTNASTTFPATGQAGYSRHYTYNALGNISTAIFLSTILGRPSIS